MDVHPRGAVVPAAVVLVLPGGRARSLDGTDPRQLTALRMRPFADALARGGGPEGLAVWTVRYRYRGWNEPDESPLVDARWALDEVRRRLGRLPVALVGHSMGGRTALRVAGDDSVRSVVALAPWVTDRDPVEHLSGRRVLVAHGTADVVTSPSASRRFVERAVCAGVDASWVAVHGDVHAMLLRWRWWHRMTTRFVVPLG